jgi:hypothetical protein
MEKLLIKSNGQWELTKMYRHPTTNRMQAELSDEPGTINPDNPNEMVHHNKDGIPSWAPVKEEQDRRDKVILGMYNNFMRNKDNPLSGKGRQLFTKLTQNILSDPDRHSVRTQGDEAQGGLRLRHLYHLLNNNPHYSIADHGDGIRLSAVRHLDLPQDKRPVHTWHINDEGVKFMGEAPKTTQPAAPKTNIIKPKTPTPSS